MQTKEKGYISAAVTVRVIEHRNAASEAEAGDSAAALGSLFEFAGSAPATFAERFPRLMVLAVSIAIIVAAITAEIDCLRGAGYYWP